mgnify:CR=1 FL=1
MPLVWPVPPLEDTLPPVSLAGPDSRFIEIDGVSVHYEAWGIPPTPGTIDTAFVLLHGFGASTFSWREVAGPLSERMPVVAFDRPAFVSHDPTAVKAFYMDEVPGRPEVCRSVDLLAPEGYGEIVGGGQRATSVELLERRIGELSLPREAYEWYLDLRRYGAVPHSGFGIGLERMLAWVCGLDHVRETIAFPRMLERIVP